MSLTDLFETPPAVMLDGKTYPVAALTLRDLVALQEMLARSYPNPLARLRGIEVLPQAHQDKLVAAAQAKIDAGWEPPALGTPEAEAWLNRPETLLHVLRLAIRRGTPGLTDAQVDAAIDAIRPEDAGPLAVAAMAFPKGDRAGAPGSPAR